MSGEVTTAPRDEAPFPATLVGVPFARALGEHGDRLAVITPDGERVTYTELARRVSDAVQRLGTGRRLVLVAAANALDPLVTYLAALGAGHPVLLAEPGGTHWDSLLEAYDPDVVLTGEATGWTLWHRHREPAHQLHPDLAVLLSTSGSTGSPKLVRLSQDNLQSNAEAIADYLDIRDTDRACVALPMHYCYGLSVINSNLLRGAGLVLTDASVTDDRFWQTVTTHQATSLHGVPYTFDLLDRVGFDRMDLPSLRYVTQAGGALAPDQVRRLARLGQRRGWRFFAMYGQTEATARMAYLPPELAVSHPHAVGVPVRGGSFEILPSDVPGQGELVYRGPNVMLGYAEGPEDLALGRTVHALPTGDIGRRGANGLYEVVGRRSRLVKLFGLRIDLNEVERILARRGHRAACTGSDDQLVVATCSAEPANAGEVVRDELGIPASHVQVVAMDELPRLPSGKIDYGMVRQLAATVTTPRRKSRSARPVHDLFSAALGGVAVGNEDTFVGLGGDSLTYVQVSIELERLLGHLPSDWHTRAVGDLDGLRRPRRAAARITSRVETTIVLRALAITLVVGTHIGVFHLLGGAHLLLVIAGWSFARFSLATRATGTSREILRSAAHVAIPAMVWLAWRVWDTTDVVLSNVLLVDNYVRRGALGYWYVEVLVQTLVVLAAVLALPPVRRWEQRHPFGFALAILAAALLANQLAQDSAAFAERSMATHGVLWFFALGWLAQRATTAPTRLVVLGVAMVTVLGYFDNPPREVIILVGVAMLLAVPTLRLPRHLVRVVGVVASASLYIYLSHYAVYYLTLPHLPSVVVLPICLGAGIALWLGARQVERGTRALSRVLRRAARRG